jgi:hypothetical protein
MKDAILKKMQEQMDRMMTEVFYGGTPPSPQEHILDGAAMARSLDQMIRNFRREQITFRVDIAHQGPVLRHETACDGDVIELSWVQANEVHQHWPLKISKVLSPDAAEFVPASNMFPDFVGRILPMPPYEMPEEDDIDENTG